VLGGGVKPPIRLEIHIEFDGVNYCIQSAYDKTCGEHDRAQLGAIQTTHISFA
jgi:hypothetical protein